MDGVVPPANARVLSSIGSTASELRRVKAHLIHGGALLLHNGVDYVRVRHRGDTDPATSTEGLLLNVTIQPPTTHHVGIRIAQSGQVYLHRKLNASSVHVRMDKYSSVDPLLGWLPVIPLEDVL